MTTLIDAAKSGNYQLVLATLRGKGSETINDRESTMKGTAIFWAANGGHHDIVEVLLAWGADMEIPVKWGMTPLLAAVDRKHCRTAQLLLEKGAMVSVQSQKGDTALHIAAYRGSSQLCKLLLAYGASRQTLNNNGKTAQQEAAGAGHMSVAKLLSPGNSQKAAVFRTSSLPLEYGHLQPTSSHQEREESRVPSENDETVPAAPSTRTSLRRKILKSALPSSGSTGGEGDLTRSLSETQLFCPGHISPPPNLQGLPQSCNPSSQQAAHHPGHSTGHRSSSPSGHRPSSPSGHCPSSPSGHLPSSPSGHRPSSPSGYHPSSPSGYRPGSPSGYHPSSPSGHWPGPANGHRRRNAGRPQSGGPCDYRPGSPHRLQAGSPTGHFNTSGQKDQQQQSRPRSPQVGSVIGHQPENPFRFVQATDQLQRNSCSPYSDSPPTDHSRNGVDTLSGVGYDTSSRHDTDAQFAWSPAAKQRKDILKEPNRFFHNVGPSGSIHNQKIARTQNASTPIKDPVNANQRELFPGIERLLAIIERLETEKNNLTKQNKALEQRLQSLQTLIDGFTTDTSSEESWQAHQGGGTLQNTPFHQTVIGELEAEKQRRADLENLCGKLVNENSRLKTFINSPHIPDVITKGTGLSKDKSRKMHVQSETYRDLASDGDGDKASSISVPFDSLAKNSVSTQSQSILSADYPHSSEPPCSLDHSCHQAPMHGDPVNSARKDFAVECWRSFNTTYLRPMEPSHSRRIISDAMGEENTQAGSRKMIYQHIKMLLQVYGGMPENWSSMPGQYLTERIELSPECELTVKEKIGEEVSDDGTVFVHFRSIINSKHCTMKLHISKTTEEAERSSAFQVEEKLPQHHHLHIPIGSWKQHQGTGGRDFRRELLLCALQTCPAGIHSWIQADPVKAGHCGAMQCRIYPDFKLNLLELFECAEGAAGASPPLPGQAAAVPGDACLLRILLQLLQALECLQERGVHHGSIQPNCVYVMKDMRIVLGGLHQARHLTRDEMPHSALTEDTAPQNVADLLTSSTRILGGTPQQHVSQDSSSWKVKDGLLGLQGENRDLSTIASMLCSLASATECKRSSGDLTASKAPEWLSHNLQCLLNDMINTDSENTLSAVKTARLRAAMLLYGPHEGDIRNEADCEEWLTAQAFGLLMNTPPDEMSQPPSGSRGIDEAMRRLDWFMCRDFVLGVNPNQLWHLHQMCHAPQTCRTKE